MFFCVTSEYSYDILNRGSTKRKGNLPGGGLLDLEDYAATVNFFTVLNSGLLLSVLTVHDLPSQNLLSPY